MPSDQSDPHVDPVILSAGFVLSCAGLLALGTTVYAQAELFAPGGLVGLLGLAMMYHGAGLGDW